MATSPDRFPENLLQFRAPPPSPDGGRRSIAINDDELAEFLEHSLHVPSLILPDRIFPQEVRVVDLPEIDFRSLVSSESDSVSKILELISGLGCFQLVNHGVSTDLIRSVKEAADGLFRISPESKAIASRSVERRFGFGDISGEEEEERSEEFFWCRDEREGLNSVMEGIWPQGYSGFRQKTENLWVEVERVASKILQILFETEPRNTYKEVAEVIFNGEEGLASVLCLYKHGRGIPIDDWVGSLKSDVMQMLIRRSDFSHALCLHLCHGASDFHIYSKKGWMCFSPKKETLIVTIGDQIQVWSGGLYKLVSGRPTFHTEEEDSISMAFLYSPPTIRPSPSSTGNKTISLAQQVIVAICLAILYQLLFYIYSKI